MEIKPRYIYFSFVLLPLFFLGCESGKTSNQLNGAASSITSTTSLYPVAGDFIDSSVAAKYIRQYSQTHNSNDKLTKFVTFRTDSLILALQKYQQANGEYVRLYFGVDSTNYVEAGESYDRLTVFFQPAKEARSQITDLEFDSRIKGTFPYNMGIICPPPKCQGVSNYYPRL